MDPRPVASVMMHKLYFQCSFNAKQVKELMAIYGPFEDTPEEFVGCLGSEPQYRGYPCSLWQLFHSMMVNAAIKGDPSMAMGGTSTVANTMFNYVHYFFACRNCAENFKHKARSGFFLLFRYF